MLFYVCNKFVRALLSLAFTACLLPAQVRLTVAPNPGEAVSLQVDPASGEPRPAFSALTPKGTYQVHAEFQTSRGLKQSRDFTVSLPGPAPLQASAQPPVVLLNGLQLPDSIGDFLLGRICPASTSTPRSAGTFGNLESLLRSEGLDVLFFDNCVECPGGTIEQCGHALGRFLERYPRAAGAPEDADLVAHSMGGLIIRSWLSGKGDSGFQPPGRTRVRKAIFLGTPHFGSYSAVSIPLLPPQVAQMTEGSPFLWNLATWNLGGDDLRGVDALAIAGAGCPLGSAADAGDGVVALTSAALSFAREPDRTRVLPFRHTSTVLGPCPARTLLANIDNAAHLSYRAVSSFLSGTDEWRAIGLSAAEHPVLSRYGGGILEWRDEQDQPVPSSRLQSGAGLNWSSAPQERYQVNLHPAETTDLWFQTPSGWVQNGAAINAGGSRPYLIKWGPWIGSVEQNGSLLTLRGANLSGLDFTIDGVRATATAISGDAASLEWQGPAGLHLVEAAGPSGRASIQWYKP